MEGRCGGMGQEIFASSSAGMDGDGILAGRSKAARGKTSMVINPGRILRDLNCPVRKANGQGWHLS